MGGFSTSRLERMREVMTRHVEEGRLPGAVTVIAQGDEAHVEAIGAMSIGGPPMARDTIFRIASLTKPVAAAAAMILVEECRLRLDDPIDDFIPELADRQVLKRLDGPLDDTVPAHRPISLRDLLTLRMGFGLIMERSGDYPIQKAVNALGLGSGPSLLQVAPEAWLKALGSLPLMRQPGEAWMYDTGLDVAGVLIARASGQALGDFLRERIFQPLGMKDTGFSVPADKIDRLADSYETNWETGGLKVWDAAKGGLWSREPPFQSARGGLVSTADDYLAFGRMMLDKGRHGRERILSRASVDLMTADQLSPEQHATAGMILDDNRGWGLGLSMVTRRDEVAASPGRFGWEGGYGTSWASDPATGLTGVLLTQRLFDSPQGPQALGDFWTLAYAALDD